MNLLYRTKASYPLAEALSRGVGSSIKSRVDSTRNGPPGAKNSSATGFDENTNPLPLSFTEAGIERNSPAHLMKEASPSVFALSGSVSQSQ
jgi:hypothetical protein